MIDRSLMQLEVITPSGNFVCAFHESHHVQAVIAEILARQNRGSAIGQHDLVNGERPLEPWATLDEAGVDDGDELFLEWNGVGGI